MTQIPISSEDSNKAKGTQCHAMPAKLLKNQGFTLLPFILSFLLLDNKLSISKHSKCALCQLYK